MFKLFNRKVLTSSFGVLRKRISTSEPQKNPIRPGLTLAFGKYLLATNTISSGVLMLLGDICQQEIEYQSKILQKRYDIGRLSKYFLNSIII